MQYKHKIGLIIMLASMAASCSPKTNTHVQVADVKDIPGMDNHSNTDNPEDVLKLTEPSASPYEKFIERWDDLEGATLDIGINEETKGSMLSGGNGRIWIVGVQAVPRGEAVIIDPKVYGKGTHSIPFNWAKKVAGINVESPLPLVASTVGAYLNIVAVANDPAIVYNNGKDSTKISIIYGHLLRNTHAANGAGPLYLASAWSGARTPMQAGDNVDLVVYMYTTIQDYAWYHKQIGANTSKIASVVKSVTLDHVIELQRFPIQLQ
jgi:hypothetical protein